MIVRLKHIFSNILGTLLSILVILFFIVIWSANFWSCFKVSGGEGNMLPEGVEITEGNPNNIRHTVITERFEIIRISLGFLENRNPDILFISDLSSLNAASFGNGTFL